MKLFCLLFCLLSVGGFLKAQEATLRGFVYDKQTGEPVIFTNVILQGTSYGAATDVNGYYVVSKVPQGKYTLTVTYLGYDTLRIPIVVDSDKIISKNLYIEKKSVDLSVFEISAEKQEAQSEVKMSMIKITPKEIDKIPSIGGESDIAQYLQVLPGVVFTGDQGGQLYIRGGAPIQNKVLMDGLIIYNPFHTIGLFSVFDTDLMRNADVFTGGFNAEYGGRISSVMDITTRDGNKTRLAGSISASTFAAKAVLEGPLGKKNSHGVSKSSFIFSAKTSYLDKTSPKLYSYASDSAGLPYSFTDIYGKMSFSGSTGSKASFFGFNYKDRVNWQNNSSLAWDSWGMGGSFVVVPQTSAVLVEGNVGYSQYEVSLFEQEKLNRFSSIDGFNMGLDLTYFSGNNELKYGVEMLGFSTNFSFKNAFDRVIAQEAFTTELSAYLKYKFNVGRLIIEPSFRVQYYASLSTTSPEPRLGVKYNVTENFRLKLAAGVYSQNLISANSDRDVVNIFNGFLSGPENLQDSVYLLNGTSRLRTHELQKANHLILGFEYDFTRNFTANVEGYYKAFTQLSNLNRNKIYEDNSDNFNKDDLLKKDFIVETGEAYGIDFVFNYEYKRWYFWAVYSLAKVNRYDGIIEYRPVFDRRHNVNLMASTKWGKDLNWEVSVRWNYGSGFPFTPTSGFYEKQTFSEKLDENYTNQNGDLGIHYSELNSGRLPQYHRMDINVSRFFILGENSRLEVNLGVTNAYNRENIFYFDRVKFERINQLPILPSFGIKWNF